MVVLITYPLQVPDNAAALLETGEFQASLLRRYLTGGADAVTKDEPSAEPQSNDGLAVGWWLGRPVDGNGGKETPAQDALQMYERVSPNARGILDQLVDRWREADDEAFLPGEIIANRLNLEPPQFRGTQASLEMRARALGRPNPVRFERGQDGGRYWLDHDAAPAFDWAQRMYRVQERFNELSAASLAGVHRYEAAEQEVSDLKQSLLDLSERAGSEAEAERVHLEELLQQAEKDLAISGGEMLKADGEASDMQEFQQELRREVR